MYDSILSHFALTHDSRKRTINGSLLNSPQYDFDQLTMPPKRSRSSTAPESTPNKRRASRTHPTPSTASTSSAGPSSASEKRPRVSKGKQLVRKSAPSSADTSSPSTSGSSHSTPQPVDNQAIFNILKEMSQAMATLAANSVAPQSGQRNLPENPPPTPPSADTGQYLSKKQPTGIRTFKEMTVSIHGHKDNVAKSYKKIDDYVKKETKYEETLDVDEQILRRQDVSEILKNNQGLTSVLKGPSITIMGHKEDVKSAVHDIDRICREATREDKADALYQTTHWCWVDGGDRTVHPFDELTSYKIHTHFKKRKDTVSYEVEGNSFSLNLKTLIETDLTTGRTTQIIREERDPSLPSYWLPQPRENDVPIEAHQVDIKEDMTEFDEIAAKFNAAFDTEGVSRKQIIQIQRIQNPRLYRQYKEQSDKLDKDNKSGNNEMSLFHGTSEDKCEPISHHGFNRSFSGDNVGAIYGKGVYFAKNSTYSADPKYCTPNSAGEQFMFVAKVLVGIYIKGHPDMKTPPAIDPSKPLVTYNSTVDDEQSPTIFVIFHDAQAYPEYLIKFKD